MRKPGEGGAEAACRWKAQPERQLGVCSSAGQPPVSSSVEWGWVGEAQDHL